MRFTSAILAAAIGAAATSAAQAAAAELPLTFARSGDQIAATVRDVPGGGKVVLAAFGRRWTGPLQVERRAGSTSVKLQAPSVRVPTVFAVAPASDLKRKVGELVVYPPDAVTWDKKVVLRGAGMPEWFDQWSQATQLPVEKVDDATQAGRQQAPREGRRLLILGRDQAGRTAADLLKLARSLRVNLLVLDARWFGRRQVLRKQVAIGPRQMAGKLADLRRQRWALPPGFHSRQLPWPGVANRWPWIAGPDAPLVEDIGDAAFGRRVVLSYLPWRQQLGRREMADELLLAILRAAAAPWPESRRLGRQMEVVHPPLTEQAKDVRPVLAAAAAHAGTMGEPLALPARPVLVLDLRGKDPPPADIAERLRYLESAAGRAWPLLILGDDPLLDRWRWLRLKRDKKPKLGVPFATWLPDDALPPPVTAQARLMGTLSELEVLLRSSILEKDDERKTQ